MNNNKIQNPKTPIEESTSLNDCDYLNHILECEKNMSVSLAIALNEASNQQLFDEIYSMFQEVKQAGRELYNLAFKNGWYTLEQAESQKISEKLSELTQKINQLSFES